MMRSGGPPYNSAKFQTLSSAHVTGGGMSLGSPFGAPPSTQRTIVSICSSLSARSFWKCWIPMVRSMCHGGICRVATRFLIERAHGRASS